MVRRPQQPEGGDSRLDTGSYECCPSEVGGGLSAEYGALSVLSQTVWWWVDWDGFICSLFLTAWGGKEEAGVEREHAPWAGGAQGYTLTVEHCESACMLWFVRKRGTITVYCINFASLVGAHTTGRAVGRETKATHSLVLQRQL